MSEGVFLGSMEVRALDFICYEVSDMAKSIAFYRDVIGLKLAWHEEDYDWAEFELSPTTLALYTPQKMEKRPPKPSGSIFLAVPDVDEALAELQAKGVEVAFPATDSPVCRLAAVRDPDGNGIGLHTRHDGTCG